ncbi:MAG: polynucleotide kinase-phosphatase, partial [Treponema sp.]|nr:polynucleotide kinase-phosphatase [Treponema sp.]
MRIELPAFALVALVGVSGSGKSTFAKARFKPTEVLSSDFFRGIVCDDENDQSVTAAAFDALYHVANKRLDLGLLTVVDATNVQKEARAKILQVARAQDCLPVAIVFDVPEKTAKERNKNRTDRKIDDRVIARQMSQLRSSVRGLRREGFRHIFILDEEAAANAEIVRVPLWNDKKDERGPFDIIGDVHGCYDELCELLTKLGYDVAADLFTANHPAGRTAVFLGDLCDRGDKNVEVLRLVMNMAQAGNARCIAGNHDVKLLKKLNGANVQLTHGLDKTVAQIEKEDAEFTERVKTFLDGLISHYLFDGGELVVAHAGLAEKYHGRSSGRVKQLCIYGETSGEKDEYGLTVRLPWAAAYRGRALVVYGHVASREVRILNNTVCIDTGCVFGGKLSAYRYPERETVQVQARREYYAPIKPLETEAGSGGILPEDAIPNIDDVLGTRYLNTRLVPSIKIAEENAAAALELASRFAVDPRWLIYLPPAMSPCETSKLDGFLEHPTEAFDYYRKHSVETVVCERKHMGSRAVIVLCRDGETARRRFAVSGGAGHGVIYTRTGRPFFDDAETEPEILLRLQN